MTRYYFDYIDLFVCTRVKLMNLQENELLRRSLKYIIITARLIDVFIYLILKAC